MEALHKEILNFADIINNNTLTEIDFLKKLNRTYHDYEDEFNNDLVLAKVFLGIVETLRDHPMETFHMIQLNLLIKKLKENILKNELPRWRLQEMDRVGLSSSKPIAL